MNKIDNCFDLLRIIAAIVVLVGHAFSWLMGIKIIYSNIGVLTFFLISGHLIYGSWERNRNKLKCYFLNRIFRIYPLLIGCNLFMLITGIIMYSKYGIIEDAVGNIYTLQGWLRNFLIESVIPGTVGLGLGSGSSWTICIELQLYMLFPIIGPLLKRLLKWQWGAVILGSLCVAVGNDFIKNILGTGIWGKVYSISCIPYIYIFLIGAFAYEYKESIIPFLQKKTVLYLAGIGIIIMELQQRLGEKICGGGYSPLATILIACIVFGVAYSYRCNIKIDLSYGIYLWHMIIINSLLLLQIKGYIGIVLSVVLAFAFAVSTYYIIEVPSKTIKEQIIKSMNRRYDEASSSKKR